MTAPRTRARAESLDGVSGETIRRAFSAIDSAKLEIPVERPGLVRRERLLARLRPAPDVRVVTVIATAGAGKSTLLAQLARSRGDEVAWVTADETDNDPKQLLRCIAAAVAGVTPIDPALETSLASPDSAALRLLPRLTNSLREAQGSVTLVIDDAHVITNPHALDVIAMLVERTPPGSQVIVGARAEPALPLSRWRAMGMLAAIDTMDLALDLPEAEHVVAKAGVRTRRADVESILEATEGWAAGVYLAAVSQRASGRQPRAPRLGDDAYISGYIESELLADLADDDLRFLTRTSILDELTGPLCDEVSGMTGSAERLDDLGRRNMLVIPVDPARRWFRYHSLLRDALRRRLERSDEATIAGLHATACAWLEVNGDTVRAVDHALRAQDVATAARLIDRSYLQIYRRGGGGVLDRWLGRIGDDVIAADELLPLVAAWLGVMQGDPAQAERWTVVTERRVAESDGATADSRVAALALLQAIQCRDGVEQMRRDVDRALELEPAHGPWRPVVIAIAGISRMLAGETDEAQAWFRELEGIDAATGTGALHIGWAERALYAIEHRAWTEAEDLVRRHRTSTRLGGVEEYQTSLLGLVAEARLCIRRSDIARARELLVRAQGARYKLTRAMPHWAVRCLTELARTQLLAADPAGAAESLRQAEGIIRERPGLGVLVTEVGELRDRVDVAAEGTLSAGSLTPAELRLLPLLQTHLTFKEMANRLGISPNTAKTESMSLYAKLNVSSRSEAVERAVELGLLESMLPPVTAPLLTRTRRCPAGHGQGLL